MAGGVGGGWASQLQQGWGRGGIPGCGGVGEGGVLMWRAGVDLEVAAMVGRRG